MGGLFGGGTARAIAGTIGDALLSWSGAHPLFWPAIQQQRQALFEDALRRRRAAGTAGPAPPPVQADTSEGDATGTATPSAFSLDRFPYFGPVLGQLGSPQPTPPVRGRFGL
jgi:hypothetical protein